MSDLTNCRVIPDLLIASMGTDHVIAGSPGPLFDAGWAAACQHWSKKLLAERQYVSRESVIAQCRETVLSCSEDAHEAAKAKDATDYVSGYQDGIVDADEALRSLLECPDCGGTGSTPIGVCLHCGGSGG